MPCHPYGGGTRVPSLTESIQEALTSAARASNLREREGEMANRKAPKRGSGVIALIAVLAALAGPSAASADPGKSHGQASLSSDLGGFGLSIVASWAEE